MTVSTILKFKEINNKESNSKKKDCAMYTFMLYIARKNAYTTYTSYPSINCTYLTQRCKIECNTNLVQSIHKQPKCSNRYKHVNKQS